MPNTTTGIIGRASRNWIAGANYFNSLIFANSLIDNTQKQNINLFLSNSDNDHKLFNNVRSICNSVYTFNQKHTILGRQSNLSNILLKSHTNIIYPANNVISKCPQNIKKIGWIPDLQFKYYPNFNPHRKSQHKYIKRILKFSDIVIVSNPFTKDDIRKYYPKFINKIKILNFSMWLGPDWNISDYLEIKEKYNLPDKYLIFPSQFWMHKNHKNLFNAIEILNRKGISDLYLLCTGKKLDNRNPSYFNKLNIYVQEKGLQNNIKIIGLIPRSEQIQMMRIAAAVIIPSLFEGWSALIDEAQSLGKKIIASKIPMHLEQKLDNISFFNPFDSQDIANTIEKNWGKLSPGPDITTEERAKSLYNSKLIKFGTEFSKICQSLN